MKRSFVIIIMALTGIALAACGGGNQASRSESEDPVAGQRAAEEESWDEVMAVHDEVMPKMGEINRLSRALREIQEQETPLPEETRQKVEAAIQELAAAEEGMWEWMNNIKQLDALRQSKNHEEILQYLSQEQEQITRVRDTMLSSIEQGEQLLNQINPAHGEQ